MAAGFDKKRESKAPIRKINRATSASESSAKSYHFTSKGHFALGEANSSGIMDRAYAVPTFRRH